MALKFIGKSISKFSQIRAAVLKMQLQEIELQQKNITKSTASFKRMHDADLFKNKTRDNRGKYVFQ